MKSFILPVLAAAATLSATNAAVIPHGEDSTPAPTHFAGDKRFLCIYFGGYWWGFGCDNDNGYYGDGGNGGNAGSAASSAASWSASSASAYSATSQAAAWSRSSSAAAYSASSSAAAYSANAAAYSTSSSAAAYSSRAGAYSQASSAAAYLRASSIAAYSASSSAAAYSANAAQYSASSSAAAYSAHAAAYSSAAAAAYSQSASAAAFSASAIAAQSSLGAYSASAAAHASQIAAFSSSASAAAYSAKQSLDSYSASLAQASQSASVAAYSASVNAAAAAQSAQAYSATSSLAAYSASVSAAAYSAGVAASASASASLAAYSASQSVAAFSASVASAASSASAYSASISAAAAQSTAVPSGWTVASTACISEGITGRALTSDMMSSGEMTWSKCTSFCGSKGYPLAGIEYASECYCDYVLSNGASLDRASNQCNMATSGNAKTIGGGPSVLSLFVSDSLDRASYSSDLTAISVALPGSWSASVGSGICVKEGSTGRALAGASYASDDMTIGKCLAFCEGKSMQYAGIEYGRECYCGNELVNGASLSDTAPCSMQCGGQPGTLCGAGNLLSIYRNANFQYTNTAVGGFAKQGCIQEVAGRALTGASTEAGDMTTAKCTSFCAAGGYVWAGIEYGSECYCGNSLSNGASLSLYSTQCNMACSGAPGETCGGPNAITLYSTLSGNALVGA